ncbi:50S ribosomal protein L17 [Candidatus Haliotispira prima]|uniref:Large ribosomal subunit protein bL17 n=1 Tax=Candidatus Haliotispira prima TaxID=3034016 RepID=A0ABY8MI79_9SPIO|nr:50S ribosomal protein L17 [Candidatus Haliotispira prima]
MNKRSGINRLDVKASHRKAIHRNMTISVFRYGRVQTTLPKAKAVRRTIERLITRAKVDSVHNRREVAKFIHDKDIQNKLFTEIGPEFVGRPGGYTRVMKTGLRRHDAAEMALIELVGHGLEEPEPKKKNSRKAAKVVSEVKQEAAPKTEEPKAEDAAAPASEDSQPESAASKPS